MSCSRVVPNPATWYQNACKPAYNSSILLVFVISSVLTLYASTSCAISRLLRNATDANLLSPPVVVTSYLDESSSTASTISTVIVVLSTIGLVSIFFGFLTSRDRSTSNHHSNGKSRCPVLSFFINASCRPHGTLFRSSRFEFG